jgi:hypothetical protein
MNRGSILGGCMVNFLLQNMQTESDTHRPPYPTSSFAFFFLLKADYSPPSIAEKNNIRFDTSTPPYIFMM